MGTHIFDRDLRMQGSDREIRQALAANSRTLSTSDNHQETADHYRGLVAQLCARHRVVVCKDDIQWILQRRKKGGAERPWRALHYHRSRDALIRVWATLCGRIDPAAMAFLLALPSHFGGAT